MSFDPTPLTAPVDRAAVRAHARSTGGGMTAGTVVGIVIGVIAVGAALVVVLPTVVVVFAGFDGGQGSAWGLVPLLVVLALIGLGVFLGIRGYLGLGERAYRLATFARANGLSFVGAVPNPPLPGLIFSQGSSRAASSALRGEHPRFVEFANYRYTTGSGKNRTTHRWGYVAIKLDAPLPHIVLDALGNNGLFGSTNLPIGFDRDQRLSLEGDFDRHFALYCPAGYERDALYLFTPDVMARFIDNAAELDVEIVDDWLFLYAKRDLVTLDPATWAWLFGAVGALLDKLAQWSRWRDERLAAPPVPDAAVSNPSTALPFDAPTGVLTPPPGVATGGRRLRRGVPWLAIVIPAVFFLGWVLISSGLWSNLLP